MNRHARRALLYIGAGSVIVGYAAILATMAMYEKSLAAPSVDVATVRNVPAVLGVAMTVKPALKSPVGWAVVPPAEPTPPLPTGPIAPAIYRIPTTQPVIFITIDDGLVPNEAALELMMDRGLVATLFLNDKVAKRHYDYFKRWQGTGSTIQNHTVNHPNLKLLPRPQQNAEICHNNILLRAGLGANPTLFRPPYGFYTTETRHIVAECGLKALVWWSATVEDGALHYQGTDRLHPGDIVLLHFTPALHHDLNVLLNAADTQKLSIGRLEDWLH